MNKSVKKITFSAIVAALYFVLCVIEGNLASGFMVNIRLAEGLLILAFFIPEVVVGCTLGCFLFNLLFGFGIYDALIGTTATLIGGALIILIGKLTKKNAVRLPTFGIGLVILNAFLVPIVLIISIPELAWDAYWTEVGIVALGEAIAVYAVGIPLYFALKKPIGYLLKEEL